MHFVLHGQAAVALEVLDIEDLTVEGEEEVVFRELDERFLDKVAAEKLGQAMEEALSLTSD